MKQQTEDHQHVVRTESLRLTPVLYVKEWVELNERKQWNLVSHQQHWSSNCYYLQPFHLQKMVEIWVIHQVQWVRLFDGSDGDNIIALHIILAMLSILLTLFIISFKIKIPAVQLCTSHNGIEHLPIQVKLLVLCTSIHNGYVKSIILTEA